MLIEILGMVVVVHGGYGTNQAGKRLGIFAQYGSLLPLAWAITLIYIIDILDPKMRPVEPSDTDTAHHPGCDLP